WDEAFAALVKQRPKDKRVWIGRVRGLARRAQWQKALDALGKLIELDPSDHSVWYHDAVLRLPLGDRKGYRRTCRGMLKRFGQTEHALVAERVVEICALVPDAVDDRKVLVKLAEQAVRSTAKDGAAAQKWFHLAEGMARYRDGQFASARDRLVKNLPPAAPEEYQCDRFAYVFLAMAYHRLGKTDQDPAALQKAGEAEANYPNSESGDLGLGWGGRLMFQAVRSEAEALIGKQGRGPTK